MKSRHIFTASAVFLSAALAVNFFSTQSTTPTPSATATPTPVAIPATLQDSDVLTWNCEIPEYKPESIMLTCADGGWMVHSITWSKWGIGGAEGTGIFREKICEPSCAEGEIAEETVKVNLSDLAERQGEFYLRTLDISTASGKDFFSGRANGLEWDVMEFAVQESGGMK
jgi:hypothetical protein